MVVEVSIVLGQRFIELDELSLKQYSGRTPSSLALFDF